MKRYALVLVGTISFAVLIAVLPFAMHRVGEAGRYGESHDFEQLRDHTFQMIQQDPSNEEIYYGNATAFFARPEYHAEVLRRLEGQIKAKPSHHAYWNLALTCKCRALAPHFRTGDDKRRFLEYYELDSDAGLPKQTDEVLVAKTIQYYRKAIELAASEWWWFNSFYPNFYSRQLVDFYSRLNRHAEALDLCKALAKQGANLSDASFLLAYGEAPYAAGKPDEAEKWLLKVRRNDHEGRTHGPACHSVDAETTLGLIAIGRGDIDAAVKHLHASTNVERCCHNITKGFPTTLASKLLDKGKSADVVEFCNTVRRDFTPHADYLDPLLARTNDRE